MSDTIMVFTRVDADGFDEFMGDPELVLAVVEDMGFDQEDFSKLAASPDPQVLYQMMEGRWSGEERNFSFEKCWDSLKNTVGDNKGLKLIESGGRNSQIYNETGPINVLTPDQVNRANDELSKLALNVTGASEEEFSLKDLFPGLLQFFHLASEVNQFVLITKM